MPDTIQPSSRRASPCRHATKRSDVSIIIVVWNAKKYVIECLESVREHCGNVSYEVIIVDNASTDGTPDLIAQRFPEFRLIRNSDNLGFAKANNIGMAQSSSEYICLVNSDVKFIGDCLSPMLNFLRQNPDVGMVGPRMLAPDGTVCRSTMRFPTIWNQVCRAFAFDKVFERSRLFGGLLMSDFNHDTTMPVEVLNGWFVIVRRSAIQLIGLLDPRFFMYAEDLDWCYRFHKAGEKVVFFAGAEAIHYGGASSSTAPVRFYLEMARANWQYWQKHYGRVAQIAFLATTAVYHLIRFLGCASLYLVFPQRRINNVARLRRSFACLRWVFQRDSGPKREIEHETSQVLA